MFKLFKPAEGSTSQLVNFCAAYFITYVIYGIVVRYFQFYPGGPQYSDIQYLVYSTLGGSGFAILVVLILKWWKMKSIHPIKWGKITFPGELFYITPSGLCTVIVILFTTLMYSIQGVSVMVAMVMMRAAVIIVSRIVDSIQIKQGILHKEVYWEENAGVLFALIAVSVQLFLVEANDFNFLADTLAVVVLSTYTAAYAVRIYIMNYFKNTRPIGVHYDNKGYFALEQITACLLMIIIAAVLFYLPNNWGGNIVQIQEFHAAIANPPDMSGWATLSGVAYGLGAFFAVFIFLFKGRTATFSALANRLTSLVAGSVSTLLVWLFLAGKFPSLHDWIALFFVFVAIWFISKGEKRRVRELKKAHEIK